MALVVCLGNGEEAILIEKLVKIRYIRIMTAADSIKVMLLDQTQILFHLLLADYRTSHRIGIVAVDAFPLDLLSVNVNHISLTVDFTDSDAFRNCFISGTEYHLIQIWILGVPKMRVLHRKYCFLRKILISCKRLEASCSDQISFSVKQLNFRLLPVLFSEEIGTDLNFCRFFSQFCRDEVVI